MTGYPIDWNLHARAPHERPAPVTIGYIGRLHPEKGLDLLIAAARLLAARPDLPPWRLRIRGPAGVAAGGGGAAWLAHLKLQAADLADRVEWLEPEFDATRLAARYGALDIFCYPSLAEQGETFGVAVAEAMAAGCAAVVSSLGCFRDLVRPDETGLTFDHTGPGAAERLAEELARLLREPAARRRLAAQGAEHVRRYDYAAVAATILGDLAVLSGADGTKPLT